MLRDTRDDDPLDDEGPDESDLSGDDDDDLARCPACRAWIAADSPRCPECGEWITPNESVASASRPGWWGIVVALLIALILVMWHGLR